VYARDEYAARRRPGFMEWLAATWDAIVTWFRSQLVRFISLEDTLPVVFWLVAAGAGLLVLFALFHLILVLSETVRGRERRARAVGPAALATSDDRDPMTWEARARDAAAAGRLRDASLALYHAIVLRLDQRGTLRYVPGKTPGDYRREAQRCPAVGRIFDRFVRHFLPLAFGRRTPEQAAWDTLRATALELGADA
jgi:hypothetical protein